jgi:hypothetical protein
MPVTRISSVWKMFLDLHLDLVLAQAGKVRLQNDVVAFLEEVTSGDQPVLAVSQPKVRRMSSNLRSISFIQSLSMALISRVSRSPP